MTGAVRQAFRDQAAACTALGSPLTARVLGILAEDLDGGVGAAVTVTLWPGAVVVPLARADFHGRWVRWLVYKLWHERAGLGPPAHSR